MRTYIMHPAEEPLRISALATVLDGARWQALRCWHPNRYDIYHCARAAWRAQNIPVPYTAIIYQLRRLVDGGNLLAFNDGESRTREEIAGLYAEARDHVLRQRPSGPVPPGPAAAMRLTA